MAGGEKTILCYGDSNTWGRIPGMATARYGPGVRWPGVMASILGPGFLVRDDALCGRTTMYDDKLGWPENRNGFDLLTTALYVSAPVDLLVVMLGVNDLKFRFCASAFDVAAGVGKLVEVARTTKFGPDFKGPPAVLVVCPPPAEEVGAHFGSMYRGAREKSLRLRDEFRLMGEKQSVPVVYAGDFAGPDPADGIHFSAEDHARLGRAMAERVGSYWDRL